MGKVIEGKTDLDTLYPEIAHQWHPTLNGNITPKQVAAHSNKRYYWICPEGHAYDASPDRRIRGDGCPYCSNRRVLKGFNDLKTRYPAIAKEWDYSLNEGCPEDYIYGSTYEAHWICSACGKEWKSTIRSRVKSKLKTCPKCAVAKRGEKRHELALKKNGCITDPLLLLEWDYEKNKKGPESYTPKSNEYAYWICSKCGYHYRSKISNRAIGRGCACCAGKVVVLGINDLSTTHPQLAKEWHPTKNGGLKPTDVTSGRAKKVWWVCPEGHEYQATILHRSSGTNCPVCNSGRQTSFAEQAVFYYVKKVFPDAVSRFGEIFDRSMELDIFIPSLKLGIEYDGEAWHKEDKRDREARKYDICKKHGIRLLRLKEKQSDTDRGTADTFLSIEDGPLYEPKYLERTIRFLLDKIDPKSNMWTRTTPVFHSRIDINIERDAAEIRSYMTRIKGSLAECSPSLSAEWHPTKNGSLTPDKVKPHSDIRVWWVCSVCGKEYRTSIGHRTNGTGCPDCGIEKSAQAKRKRVAMLDPSTGEKMQVFTSLTNASKSLGISSSNISMVCKGRRKTAGGYGWAYIDD